MDIITITLFGIGMFLSGLTWDQLEVHTPNLKKDDDETVTPQKGA